MWIQSMQMVAAAAAAFRVGEMVIVDDAVGQRWHLNLPLGSWLK